MTSDLEPKFPQEGSVSRAPGRGSRWPLSRPGSPEISAPEISGPSPTPGVTVGVRRAVVRSVAGMAVYYLWPWAAAVVVGWATNPFLGIAIPVAVMGWRAIREGVAGPAPGAEVERRGERSPGRWSR